MLPSIAKRRCGGGVNNPDPTNSPGSIHSRYEIFTKANRIWKIYGQIVEQELLALVKVEIGALILITPVKL